LAKNSQRVTAANISGPIASIVAGIFLDHFGEKFIVVVCTSLIIIGGINILLSVPKKN